MRGNPRSEGRWKARPIQAALLRAFIYVVPMAAALATAAAAGAAVPRPEKLTDAVMLWTLVLAASTTVLFVTDPVVRRLLPLATLLKLSLAFPDRVPSRIAIARRVGSTRSLQERVEAARAAGRSDEPTRTAEAILELVVALTKHDKRTRGHAERVRVFTDLLADEMNFSVPEKDRLRWASLLHDIGKLDVPPKLLNKAGKPSASEWEVLRLHPEAGARFIGPLLPWLGEWARAITEHHERWDGAGYPNRLAGQDVFIGARVVAVADSYEVMTAPRPYKRPMGAKAARAELTKFAGSQFDPAVVRAFLSISIGRLRMAMGPISWITQLPFLPKVATGVNPVGATVSQAVAAGALASTTVGRSRLGRDHRPLGYRGLQLRRPQRRPRRRGRPHPGGR